MASGGEADDAEAIRVQSEVLRPVTDRAQGALNFLVFATMAVSALFSGVLVTTRGWSRLNWGSLLPVAVCAAALLWLAVRQRTQAAAAPAR